MWLKFAIGASVVAVPLLVVLTSWLMCHPRQLAQAASGDRCDIACSLSPSELPERRARLAAFRSKARRITELESGYAMHFDLEDQTLLEAASLAAAESHCCGFLDFQITVQPSRGRLAVEMTGPLGAKKFLTENVFANASSAKAAESSDDSELRSGTKNP
jgi:hypothetical protein